jgi:four helix bundle protein
MNSQNSLTRNKIIKNMRVIKFEDLKIWQIALKITKEIYDITSKKEFSKDFSLRDQMRRAIISVSSNIVEGFEKNNNNEFIRFLKIAKGSIGEVRNQLYIALAVKYIEQDEFEKLNNELIELANQVGKFISYLERNKKLVNSSTRNKTIKK